MQNPFETGHIKNYLFLYASVVVIMVLFFIATTLFHDIKEIEPKIFDKNVSNDLKVSNRSEKVEDENRSSRFRLLEKAY